MLLPCRSTYIHLIDIRTEIGETRTLLGGYLTIVLMHCVALAVCNSISIKTLLDNTLFYERAAAHDLLELEH